MEPQLSIPRPKEIRLQLDRILQSPLFRNAATQSTILRYMTECAIDGVAITENDLKLLDPDSFSAESHKYRVGALLVRKKVAKYYEDYGVDDLVRLNLVSGRSYRVEFAYHESAAALRAYSRGELHLKTLSFLSLLAAENEFLETLSIHPAFVPAIVGRAKAILLRVFVEHLFGMLPYPNGNFIHAEASLADALELHPGCVEALVLKGATMLFRGKWKTAFNAFEEACNLDEDAATRSLFYPLSLMAIRRSDEALNISFRNANEDVDDASRQMIHALLLYLNREYKSAQDFCHRGIESEGESRFRHVLEGLIAVETEQFEMAFHRFSAASKVDYDLRRDHLAVEAFITGKTSVRTEHLSGLIALALARKGDRLLARQMLDDLNSRQPKDNFQTGIAYMALNDSSRAVKYLDMAFSKGNLLRNWVHVVPLFDSLRSSPRFQLLIECAIDPIDNGLWSFE
jgi:tetratricopeptide (TPR) repeat protein